MRARFLATAMLFCALGITACSSSVPAAPTSVPAPTQIPATSTSVPASPTPLPPSPTPLPTVAPSPTTAAPTNTALVASTPTGSAVASGDLGKLGAAMAAATSYRATITTSNSTTGQPTTAVLEVVKPDRFHVKATMGTSQTVEVIAIGHDSYINLAGTWTKSPAPFPLASLIGNDPLAIQTQLATSQKAGGLTQGGTSEVNGATCQEYAIAPAAGASKDSGGTICIDLKTGLMSQFKSTDGKSTVVFSDWNTPISIVAPI